MAFSRAFSRLLDCLWLTCLPRLLLDCGVHAQTCLPNCPYTANKFASCENRQQESASPAEGYALQFGPQTIASTKSR